MKLVSPDGQRLTLGIVGYQFPETTSEYWNANWLVVSVDATHPTGSWHAADPCLLTFEVAELASWLSSLAEAHPVARELKFIEPNIAFEHCVLGAQQALRVYFALELRPGWVASSQAGRRDFYLEFTVTSEELVIAAACLRSALTEYPERGSR